MESNAYKKSHIGHVVLNSVKDTPVILIFAVFFVISLFFVSGFAKPENLINIIQQSSDLIILSCGMTYVLLNGSIDFSITGVLPFASITGAYIMRSEGNPYVLIFLAIIVMLSIGVGIGLLNGVAVSRFRMPSFITTMAVQLCFSGLALLVTQSATIGGIPNQFTRIAQGYIGYVPVAAIIAILIVIIFQHLLSNTLLGRRIIAVGTNQHTSLISGINVKKTITTVFVICGFLAAMSSILTTSRMGAGMPGMGQESFMNVIVAVVIGGTSIFGGRGTCVGTAFGAVFVIMLNNCMNLIGINWFVINIFKGCLVLFAAYIYALRDSRQLR